MRVLASGKGMALVEGRGEQREIETLLLGDVQPGEWLLVFINSARERIGEQRAAEVNQMLDMLAGVMGGYSTPQASFALPSSMNTEQLARIAGLEKHA